MPSKLVVSSELYTYFFSKVSSSWSNSSNKFLYVESISKLFISVLSILSSKAKVVLSTSKIIELTLVLTKSVNSIIFLNLGITPL